MTQPVPNGTPSASAEGHLGELTAAAAIAVLLAHDATVEALEHRAAAAASTTVRFTAQTLITWTARTWVTRYGSLDTRIDPGQWADLRPIVIRQVRTAAATLDPAPVVATYAREAFTLGIAQAADELHVPAPTPVALAAPDVPAVSIRPAELEAARIDTRRTTPRRPRPVPQVAGEHPLSPVVEDMAHATTATVVARYERAERLLIATPVESHAELVEVLSPTQAAASDVERDTRTVVNTALNDGVEAVARHHDADLLWMSERDACVVCLGLAGTVVSAGEDFPLAATFGTRPTEWWTPDGGLLRPPRHPRCRCRCVPWLGHAGPGPSLPEVLRREAERAVLRGWSRPSESEQVRVQAAERLLARGSVLPKTVQAAAREAVRRGRFTSRDVPQISGR